jgi:carboxyl-terminal processing protease
LEAAVDIASWFLPHDALIVTEDYGGNEENKTHRSRGYADYSVHGSNILNSGELKMIILTDGGTASASEILAGALSEHKKVKLLGMTTYGKGSVQELIPITPETSLKLTVAHWRTPQGRIISEKGLEPDVKVEYTKEDREKERDPQKEKALEMLLNWKK